MRPTNKLTQAAFVVPDLRSAIDRWLNTANVGPFYVMENISPENGLYRGTPAPLTMHLAFAQAGPMQIELIEQVSAGPSMYRDSIAEGAEGFHHIGYFTHDLGAEINRHAGNHSAVAYQATFGTLSFAYLDTRAQIGCMTEVMQHDANLEGMFQMIADASVDWDGNDPVRMITG